MELLTDASAHDALQLYLTKVLATDIHEMLTQAGLSGAQLREAVHAVTFGVATIIDGSRQMEHGDRIVLPVLTFGILEDDDEEERLQAVITSGEPSFMHEYVSGTVEELFE